MNEEVRYVMGIYQVAVLINQAIQYTLPAQAVNDPETSKQLVDMYQKQVASYQHFVEDGSPIMRFCDNNGENGAKVKTQLLEFGTDVFGINRTENSNTPLVSVITNAESQQELRVEYSMICHLFDMIVGLHETISDIMTGYVNYFKGENIEIPGIEPLLKDYEVFYRSNIMVGLSISICNRFSEYNRAANNVINTARANGVDVNSPSFNYTNDPSVHYIGNEIATLINLAHFVKSHNHSESGELQTCFAEFEDKLGYISGQKKLEDGKRMEDALQELINVFAPLLRDSTPVWAEKNQAMYSELVTYEQELFRKMQENAKKADEEKAAEAAKAEAKEEKAE